MQTLIAHLGKTLIGEEMNLTVAPMVDTISILLRMSNDRRFIKSEPTWSFEKED